MFGAGVSGFYKEGKSKQKSSANYWTTEQGKVAQGLGTWLGGVRDPATGTYSGGIIDPETGQLKPVAAYQGQLAGTYTPQTMSTLFSGAQGYAQGDMTAPGSQLFQHYQQYADPAERDKRIQEAVAARQAVLDPMQTREDAEMRAKMASMGLQHSSDMLKAQSDIERTRQAETTLFAMDMRDKYEQLGFEASEAALTSLQNISQAQYEITNAGLEAQFQEWLRQQPEYNPMVEVMMQYLGLQGVAQEKGRLKTTEWGASGQASYMSDLSVKTEIVDLTPIAFKFKEGLGQDDQVHIGVIAQEVERLYPHLVEEKEVDGRMIKHVDYQTLCAILLLALKARS